jgi:hypothetical protein
MVRKIVESAWNGGDSNCCVNGERLVQAEVSDHQQTVKVL